MKRLAGLVFAALLSASCGLLGPLLPPGSIPTPPPHNLVFHVYNHAREPLNGATGHLVTDSFGTVACPEIELAGVLICPLTTQTGGAWMQIEAEGYTSVVVRVILPLVDSTADDIELAWATPEKTLQRLFVSGKSMKRADGTDFAWQGITAFQLLDDLNDGRTEKAVALLDWAAAHEVTVVRVLAMARGLFQLEPSDGRANLPRLLELAEARGIYVEVVALADTRSYQFDHRAHVSAIGHICTLAVNCVIEIANEPNHSTQDSALQNPTYLASLRNLIPANIMVSLGASHGPDDESQIYTAGDYVTVHISRTDGDGGWRWVRHAREIQNIRDAHHHKFVVNDEPGRDVPRADQHLALGLLMRMYGIGDTVHLGGLRFDDIPVGDELAAFEARQLAWRTVQGDWSDGRYSAAHLADSPVKVDSTEVLRAYSSLRGDNGYTILIKVTGESKTTWRRPHTLLVKLGLTEFYSVS
jgi:hypothetical protein